MPPVSDAAIMKSDDANVIAFRASTPFSAVLTEPTVQLLVV